MPPQLPGFQQQSNIPMPPQLPGFQQQSNIPMPPQLPGFQQQSNISMPPQLPGISSIPPPPQLPGFSNSNIPAPPQLPGFAQGSGIPAPPQLPGFHQGGGIPAPPLLPGFSNSGIPAPPQLPGMGGIPRAPIMGGIPQAPVMGGIPQAPVMGGIPRAPVMGGIPAAPQIPGRAPLPPNLNIPQGIPLQQPQKTIQEEVQLPPKGYVCRKFHINVIPKYKLKTTFWNQPPETIDILSEYKFVKVDYQKLFEQFCEKAQEDTTKKATKVQPTVQKQQILSAKTNYNASIVVSTFGQTKSIVTNLLTLETIQSETFQKLLSILPKDEDEFTKLKDYNGSVDDLSAVEAFLWRVVQIPRVRERMKVAIFSAAFTFDFYEYYSKTQLFKEPIKLLKEDKSFKLILHFLLRIANYLNHGTAKANATGFTIDSLSIVDSIKSCDKKTTILHYIVRQISIYEKKCLDFFSTVIQFDSVVKIEVAELETKKKEFEIGFQQVTEELKQMEVILSNSKNDQEINAAQKFIDKFAKFIEMAETKIEQYSNNITDIKQNIKDIGLLYGENNSYQFKEFLQRIIIFANSADKLYKKMMFDDEQEELKKKQKEEGTTVNRLKSSKTQYISSSSKAKKKIATAGGGSSTCKNKPRQSKMNKGPRLSQAARTTINELSKLVKASKNK